MPGPGSVGCRRDCRRDCLAATAGGPAERPARGRRPDRRRRAAGAAGTHRERRRPSRLPRQSSGSRRGAARWGRGRFGPAPGDPTASRPGRGVALGRAASGDRRPARSCASAAGSSPCRRSRRTATAWPSRSRLLGGVDTRRLEVWLGADRLDRLRRRSPRRAPARGRGRLRRPATSTCSTSTPASRVTCEVEEPLRLPGGRAALAGVRRVRWRCSGTSCSPRASTTPRWCCSCTAGTTPATAAGAGAALPDAAPGPRRAGQWPCPGASSRFQLSRLRVRAAAARLPGLRHGVDLRERDQRPGLRQPRRRCGRPRSALVRHHLEPDRAVGGRPRQATLERPGRRRPTPCWSATAAVARVSPGRSSTARRTPPWYVLGQVLVAPTDFARLSTPYTPCVTLLPYCDGDVIDLQGQQYTDLPRDLTTDDTAFRSSVLMRGANHNFFNAQWTPGVSVAPSFDDWFDDDHPLCGAAAHPAHRGRSSVPPARRGSPRPCSCSQTDDTEMLPMLDAAGSVHRAVGRRGGGTYPRARWRPQLLRPGVDGAVPVRARCAGRRDPGSVRAAPAAPGVTGLPRTALVEPPRPGGVTDRAGARAGRQAPAWWSGSFLDEPARPVRPGTPSTCAPWSTRRCARQRGYGSG